MQHGALVYTRIKCSAYQILSRSFPSRAMSKSTTNGTSNGLRVLMLHGYTQSGPLFHAKTRALEKNLKKAFPSGIELIYPTGPLRIRPADIPGFLNLNGESSPASHGLGDQDSRSDEKSDEESDCWGWWIRKGDTEPFTYWGMEDGLARVAETLKSSGPFDGVIGFSQGGALAGMVASLLEAGRREGFASCQEKGGMAYPTSFEEDTGYVTDVVHPPLKFAVSYSGFGASTNPLYQGYYTPPISTPMLHFIGSVDTVVEEKRSLRLVDACVDGRGKDGRKVVYHPGGHFLPSSQKQYVAALVGFIRESLGGLEEDTE